MTVFAMQPWLDNPHGRGPIMADGFDFGVTICQRGRWFDCVVLDISLAMCFNGNGFSNNLDVKMAKAAKSAKPAVGLDFVVADEGLNASEFAEQFSRIFGVNAILHDSIEAATATGTSPSVVIVMRNPASLLAARLTETADCHVALEAWSKTLGQVLSRQRRARRRLSLVDASLFLSTSTEAWAPLGARLGLTADPMAAALAEVARPDSVPLLAAAAMIERDHAANALASEFVAAAFGNAEDGLSPQNIELALEEWQNAQAATNLFRENASLQNLAQSELDQRLSLSGAQTTSLHEQISALLAEQEVLKAKLREVQTAVSHPQSEEVSLLRDNIGHHLKASAAMQAELADRHLLKAKTEALEQRLKTAESAKDLREAILATQLLRDGAEMAALRDERDSMIRSKSWRWTRPLRGVRRRIGNS